MAVTLFGDVPSAERYPSQARRELRQVLLELAFETDRADALRRAAAGRRDLAFKADAADVRVAVLRARAAQLRRAAGRLDHAA